MRAWVNGRLMADPEGPALSVLDHGITVGDGVFETVKVDDGRPFALRRHLERLRRSAEGLRLAVPEPSTLRAAVEEVLAAEHLTRGLVRITVTGGRSPLGSERGEGPPTVAVVGAPLAHRAVTTAVVTVPWARNERGALAGLKTTSYAENVVAIAHARERGASEALFANTAGDVCEGTGTNVFYVVDRELRTPSLASGCLAGVTRDLVLEWYGGVERDEPMETLGTADEMFLASTTREVQPVHRCDDRELPAPGPVTAAVRAAWEQHARPGLDP